MKPIIPGCDALVLSSETMPELIGREVKVIELVPHRKRSWRVDREGVILWAPEHRLMRIDSDMKKPHEKCRIGAIA